MHYQFDGLTIRTENAAKPISQASRSVLDWIRTLPKTATVLDYGCGKFRYTIPLARQVKRVIAVDSSNQIERVQTINKRRGTLRMYATKYLSNVKVYEVSEKDWARPIYDVILCTNVLSTIPRTRDRIALLRRLRGVMDRDTILFLCTQFRNSYFRGYEANPNARYIKDGWLVRKNGTGSFYAILPPDELKTLCKRASLCVTECYSKGESAYVHAAL